MALRRVFSLSHAPASEGLAAKDFFVTYFDPTVLIYGVGSEIDSTSERDQLCGTYVKTSTYALQRSDFRPTKCEIGRIAERED